MPENPRRSSILVRSAAVTLAIGLFFVAVGVESLAVFNACVADPACLPYLGALDVGAFFAILAVGIALAVVGTWTLLMQSRTSRTIPA